MLPRGKQREAGSSIFVGKDEIAARGELVEPWAAVYQRL
jgi:hypothetical protein